ncbi:IQ motif, EF-hand binding site-containing protein [Cynara cardunculus var. scolymus]|uniref:IQ motif, EF-hand binding site-containing protein n=1 Tax=Cynara cardunculus var. scolymus TaxID=59895 RepID=A0A103Y004_CYNCS|nr:IQ motif, EF-hand binding site-containing protein [Cynara cardunculus var. scolymus]
MDPLAPIVNPSSYSFRISCFNSICSPRSVPLPIGSNPLTHHASFNYDRLEVMFVAGNDTVMGKKGSWLSSIKKALSPSSKGKKSQKSKKKGVADEKPSVPITSFEEVASGSRDSPSLPPPEVEEVKPIEVEDEQTKHADLVAAEAEASVSAATVAAQAAAESARLAELTRYSGMSKVEVAAIRIQTTFRGYLARRALRALRGLVRLKTLVEGPTANRQTANTLKCMQHLSRVQCQINSRRIRMSEENQALQRQILQKQAKEIESLQVSFYVIRWEKNGTIACSRKNKSKQSY